MIRNCLVSSRGLNLFGSSIGLFLRSHHNNADPYTRGKPNAGCIRLNFDGASKYGTGDASIGGVYRNHEGVFLFGYAERIGKATSSVAELVAAKRGLELAIKNGWFNIWIEGDAKGVVDLITNRMRSKSKEDLRHFREISVLIPQLKYFKASHIYREGNKVAHRLAKLGYKMHKPQIWWDVPPDEVLRFLRQDAEGQIITRRKQNL
ncbi:uncharacterized protein LOC103717323 [Phoenix dactylifera]|uniref:Uncharacterized protein LOC103717323 n=1 Tax=Phoenix dactylifera TaxID=42345 RepID=A0A8B7CQ18_PHODC|nr:uncharacterized protein LOC103717323 [Phoenix dactylifera]